VSVETPPRDEHVIEPAPPFRGEGPHALWHASEDPTIERFEPRDGKIWAIDTRHLPLYWFPRDCPRATFWAVSTSGDSDVAEFLGGDRRGRTACGLLALWDRVVASTLDFSGIRLRNARLTA
jgi:hypothetical protein